MISRIKSQPLRIVYNKFIHWPIDSALKLANALQLYVFSDASYTSASDEGSVESYILAVGRPHSRNGDILCVGSYVDGGARRIARVCRSSLGSESVALGNAADTGLFVRVMLIELVTGKFAKDIVGPSVQYKLFTPFGVSPHCRDGHKRSGVIGQEPKTGRPTGRRNKGGYAATKRVRH